MKFKIIFITALLSILLNNAYSFTSLELSKDLIEVEISDTSSIDPSIINIPEGASVLEKEFLSGGEDRVDNYYPLSLTVENDGEAYSLEVDRRDFSEFPFDVYINIDEEITETGTVNNGAKSETVIDFPLNKNFKLDSFAEEFIIVSNPYTSSQQIDLSLVLKQNQDLAAGIYETAFIFKLLVDGMAIDERELNIKVEVKPYLKIVAVFHDSMFKKLDFGIIRESYKTIEKEVDLIVLSNIGVPFKIMQRRSRKIISDISDIELYDEDIFYEIDRSENLNGTPYKDEPENLSEENDLIIISDEEGSTDKISLVFTLLNNGNIKAGKYEGELFYELEFDQSEVIVANPTFSFPISLEIEKIFAFTLVPEDSSLLYFNPGMMMAPPYDKLMRVNIKSNTGRPYKFFHSLPDQAYNLKGGKIDADDFTFALCDKDGKLVSGEVFVPVENGFQDVYSSDETGSSAEIFIRYRIDHTLKQMAGSYSANLHYKLNDD